ncbi:hypothetical protein TTHERM_000467909 (macronuclear) [Tetrahymena thermophila SB210]|uniref:Uncharacterized protein n=1 Tax=Tetrahymena thermophila (strain SB210) TaxID=312017 RepID=W7XD62_TETTS|nr:hypothetical protein TTHERM_000467909 [Tetrahymena thermophila SB210]EWS71761.1 hypothetical protein TTHERM_000467909 [Tetrahymena thermophila SB210]|eukprot:XP_012655714.1 hypothetical protein TTHERM_000467909 [Tetrahymena thermophila SB210]
MMMKGFLLQVRLLILLNNSLKNLLLITLFHTPLHFNKLLKTNFLNKIIKTLFQILAKCFIFTKIKTTLKKKLTHTCKIQIAWLEIYFSCKNGVLIQDFKKSIQNAFIK